MSIGIDGSEAPVEIKKTPSNSIMKTNNIMNLPMLELDEVNDQQQIKKGIDFMKEITPKSSTSLTRKPPKKGMFKGKNNPLLGAKRETFSTIRNDSELPNTITLSENLTPVTQSRVPSKKKLKKFHSTSEESKHPSVEL